MAALECEIVPIPPAPTVVLSDDLTNKQKAFVCHYLEIRNGVKAARLAGYEGDENTLKVSASRLLTKDNVKAAIDSYFQSRILSANGVLAELSDIAFSPWRDHVEVKTDDQGNIIDAKLNLRDKNKALELVGKFHKLFVDKVETETSLSDTDVQRIGESLMSSLLEAAQRRRLTQVQDVVVVAEPDHNP